MIDDALVTLANRTLYAFAMGGPDEALWTEWEGYTILDVGAALTLICIKLKELRLVPQGSMVQLMLLGPDGGSIDDAPPGIRCGVRMITAGMNGDAVMVRDLLTAFLNETEEHSDEMLQTECAHLFQTVFSGAAAMVHASADRAELN